MKGNEGCYRAGWLNFFFYFTTVGPCNIMYMNSRTFSNLGGREDTVWVNNFLSERRNVVWKALLRDLASSSAFMVLWLSNYQCLVGFIKRQCNYIVVLKKMLWFTWVGSCRSLMLKFVFSQRHLMSIQRSIIKFVCRFLAKASKITIEERYSWPRYIDKFQNEDGDHGLKTELSFLYVVFSYTALY